MAPGRSAVGSFDCEDLQLDKIIGRTAKASAGGETIYQRGATPHVRLRFGPEGRRSDL